jgi:hypothetical protein
MTMNVPVNFFASSDVVVVGQDAEAVDVDNPRGYIYGFSAYVVAEDKSGNRVKLFVKSSRFEADVLPVAEKQAAALTVRLGLGKLPVRFASWDYERPGYGSDAWIEYGADEELALERKEAEDEAFF